MSLEGRVIEGRALDIAAWQDQCFLVDSHKFLLDQLFKGGKPDRWTDLIAVDVSSDPGTLISGLNGNSSSQSEFFKLSPHQLSLLVPKVRLFITRYKTSPAKPDANAKARLVWDKNEEILFDAHTKERTVLNIMSTGQGRAYGAGLKSFEYEFDGKDPATTEKSIKARVEILLTSFDQLVEKQPTGAKMIDLLLRSPQMIPRYDVKAANNTSSDVIDYCRAPKLSRDIEKKGSELVFNPKFRRIKAVVGWAAPLSGMLGTAEGSKLFTTAQLQMIEDTQLNLFLEMTDYNLDFNNNGTVKLSIDYRASLEGALLAPQADVFFVLKQQIKDRQIRTEEKIRKLKEDAGAAIDRVERETSPPERSNEDPEETEREKRIKGVKEDLEAQIDKEKAFAKLVIAATRNNYYRHFLSFLMENDKLFKVEIPNENLLRYRGIDFNNMSDEDRQLRIGKKERSNKAYAEARQGQSASDIRKNIKASLANYISGSSPERIDNVGPNEKTDLDCELMRMRHDQRKDQEKAGQGRQAPQLPGQNGPEDLSGGQGPSGCNVQLAGTGQPRKIFFMLMGDILNTVMFFVNHLNSGVYYENFPADGAGARISPGKMGTNIRLVTMNIDFSDINDLVALSDGKINIADIPVSLSEFSIWFRRNVIKKKRTSYMAGDFIQDVINDLFYRALGDACYAGRGQTIPQLSTTIVSTRTRKKGTSFKGLADPKTKMEAIPRTVLGPAATTTRGAATVRNSTQPGVDWYYKRIVKKSELRKFTKFVKGNLRPKGANPDDIVHYYILHGTAKSVISRVANKAKDEKDGIYHLGIGQDRGAVQKINFSGTDLKYAAEARTIFDGQDGLGQLFQKFDANVDLYGCPIFRNGQYIYLDPKTLGHDLKTAQAIGMGGYYNIYNVIGEITPAGFTTKLKCTYNSNGLCADSKVQAAQPSSTSVAGAGSGLGNAPAAQPARAINTGAGTLCTGAGSGVLAVQKICQNKSLTTQEQNELIKARNSLSTADKARFDKCYDRLLGGGVTAAIFNNIATGLIPGVGSSISTVNAIFNRDKVAGIKACMQLPF